MKTLVDEIRDMVSEASVRNMYPVITDAAEDLLGRSCWSYEDEAELFTIIADRIEREYMELPILEGEPLKVGDKVDGYNQEGAKVEAVMNDKMVVVRSTVKGVGGYHDEAYPLLLWCVDDLKRHVHEVLDADGVPIKVGDHVWWKDGREFVITAVNRGVNTEAVEPAPGMCSSHVDFDPKEFTHKQPDTLERIEEDARKALYDYWGCGDAECSCCPAIVDGKKPYERYVTADGCFIAQRLDLLRRQREVLERGQA